MYNNYRSFKGDILKNLHQFDAVCITTNGIVKKNGACVMGAGIARIFRDKYPGIDRILGNYIKRYGNRCFLLGNVGNTKIMSFVVKHHWSDKASLQLIEKSAKEIVKMADKYNLKHVAIPRPGCGNGKLSWEEVKPILDKYLDDRFIICTF